MEDRYKLVHSVDPSKCRAKIRDKFSKLALSSSKKKQEQSEMTLQLRDQIPKANVSRNLLSELLTDDDSDQEVGRTSGANLLTRTDSSSSIEKKQSKHNETDATHCSQVEHAVEKSFEMEALMVSGLENTQPLCDLDDAIEKLSSRVSSLAVGVPRTTISSENNPHEVSRIVSTENQRMISKQRHPVAMSPKLKEEPNVSACVSLSSDESSDSPITISDSSEDEDECHANVSSPAPESVTQTMVTVKADRMAAFLRDVRRNYGLPSDSPDRDFERRQKEIAAADTEPMTAENDSRSAGTARRIATADTESMTESPEKETNKNESQKRLALDDTKDMTKLDDTLPNSPHYMPVMKVGPDLLDESVTRPDSVPDDSLTIAETSEEENEESFQDPQPQPTGTENAVKRSQSTSQLESKDSSVSSYQNTQVHINISAKINIKIQVSQQMEDSSSSEFTNSSQSVDQSSNESSEVKTHNSAQKAQHRAIEDVPHSPPEQDNPKPATETSNASPDDFMDKAQRLLNELYGNQWKTPEVMRSLKKIPPTSTHRLVRRELMSEVPESPPEPIPASNLKVPESPGDGKKPSALRPQNSLLEHRDESVLGDFSIFRKNIPQDLDSTRLPPSPVSTFKTPKAIIRPPKAKKEPIVSNAEVTKTRSGRQVRNNYREIVISDDESEGENASADSDNSWEMPDKEEVENRKPDKEEVENTKPDKEEIENRKPAPTRRPRRPAKDKSKNDDELIYLDLSKNEVEVQLDVSASPPANHDKGFNSRLDDILKSSEYKGKPKLECTPSSGKTKRKLFSAQLNDDGENITPPFDSPRERLQNIVDDDESVSISGSRMPAKFEPFNKYLESVKLGKPIFKIQTPKSKTIEDASPTRTPKPTSNELRVIGNLSATPKDKYGFLKSLDLCVGKSLCHPDALYYRDNFRTKKEELGSKLYEIYNKKCFDGVLDVPIKWNKKLTNTAGRCMNKKRLGERTCAIELSEKVLTSADRLRCTLIHELCHAATWILNGEGGHGATWKSWARKANDIFPELPKIGVCHQYDIEYKYTYKCTLCAAKSHAHSKSKKVENIRCSYCHGAIEVYLNKKDKDGKTVSTPVREPTGFAKFVKDKYKDYKRPDLKHADVMKLLSNEFASMKVGGKS